jgi:diadenosine tetraphosphate (Ap4A) HIT family hydrolase
MEKPDFSSMSKAELKRYVLSHRDDDEAFYAFVDMVDAQGGWIKVPPLESMEDLEKYPEIIEKILNDPGRMPPE